MTRHTFGGKGYCASPGRLRRVAVDRRHPPGEWPALTCAGPAASRRRPAEWRGVNREGRSDHLRARWVLAHLEDASPARALFAWVGDHVQARRAWVPPVPRVAAHLRWSGAGLHSPRKWMGFTPASKAPGPRARRGRDRARRGRVRAGAACAPGPSARRGRVRAGAECAPGPSARRGRVRAPEDDEPRGSSPIDTTPATFSRRRPPARRSGRARPSPRRQGRA